MNVTTLPVCNNASSEELLLRLYALFYSAVKMEMLSSAHTL